MAYFDKAGAILTTTQLRAYPPAQGLLVRLLARQAEIQAQLGDRAAMRRSLEQGLATGRKLATASAASAQQALPLIDILIKAALLSLGEERYDDALDLARECKGQTLRQEQTLSVRDLLSSCWSAESRAESGRGHVEEAIAAIRRAIALREDVLHDSPANNTARRALLIAYSHLSAYLGRPTQIRNARDTEGALKAMEKAREHAEFIFKSDPDDRLAQRDLAMSTTRLADLYMGANRYAEAAPHLARGAELLQVTVKNLPADNFTRAELVYTYKRLADALRPGDETKVLQALKAGVAANQELEKAPSLAPGSYLSAIEIRIEMAKAVAATDPAEAQRHLDHGLATLARARAQHPAAASLILFEIRMEAEAGTVYEKLSRPDLARQHREKALAAYRSAPASIQSRLSAEEREALQARLHAESR
jgi:hypothetical protein